MHRWRQTGVEKYCISGASRGYGEGTIHDHVFTNMSMCQSSQTEHFVRCERHRNCRIECVILQEAQLESHIRIMCEEETIRNHRNAKVNILYEWKKENSLLRCPRSSF